MSTVFLTLGQSKKHLKTTEVGFWKPREAREPGEKRKQSPCFLTRCPVFYFFEEAIRCSPEMMAGWRGRTEKKDQDRGFTGDEETQAEQRL